MYYYKAQIQYEGTNYSGFQWQKETPTIQNEFNTAVSKIIGDKFSTTAASRTDTGVHAMDQVVKISSHTPIEQTSFLSLLNHELPREIRCLKLEDCEGKFKPAVHALSKEYRYFFTNKTQVSKNDCQFIANISNVLDIDAMMVCVRALVGTHDFCNFYSAGSNVKSTTRNIYQCELSIIDPQITFSHLTLFNIPNDISSCFELKIIGNGFLKQMIRHIVSALWMVGSGKLSTDDFLYLLSTKKVEGQRWKVATSAGLFLFRINYQ